MSSEYSIHLGDKPIKGRVYDLGSQSGIMVTVEVEASDFAGNAGAAHRLFVDRDRLLEVTLLFHKIAQDLAALLPDVDACCRCVPGTPDDQCAVHGCGAFKIRVATSCSLCGQRSPGGEAHPECIGHERAQDAACIPIEEAAEHVDPPHRWG